jgi:MFS family permease
MTDNLVAIYVLFAVMVTAMGVTATVLTADSTQIAAPDELGSFFGLQAAIENGAGLAGPLIGGALGAFVHPVKAPLAAVLTITALLVTMVALGYDDTVLQHNKKRAKVD